MNELDKLRQMLTDAGIPFESYEELYPDDVFKIIPFVPRCDAERYSRNQIIYGRTGSNIWKLDAILLRGSYGRYEGKIEIWGALVKGDPIVATAAEAFERIKADFNKERDEK